MNRALALLLSLLACSATGAESSDAPHPPPAPRLTARQAIDIANSKAKSSKVDLSHFGTPTATYEFDDGAWVWKVFYSVEGVFDDCLWVVVIDRSGRAKVSPCIA